MRWILPLASLLLPVTNIPDDWQTYTNDRYHFSVCHPVSMEAKPTAIGEGMAFTDGTAKLTVWGALEVYGHTMSKIMQDELLHWEKQHATITHQQSKTNWYVLTGTSGDTEFHTQTYFHGRYTVSLFLTYPKHDAATYHRTATQINRCFVDH